MTTLCKKAFSTDAVLSGAFFLLSIFVHLLVFIQLRDSISPSSFNRLIGKRGGPEDAREIAFFPRVASQAPTKSQTATSPLNVPTARLSNAAAPASTEPTTSGTSAKGIGQGGTATDYSSVLHAFLDAEKVYPSSLKSLGLSGIVKVRFDVTREGYLENIRLADSEAPALLQKEALKFLKTLDRVPIPPTHLAQHELQFELPLRYELKS